MLFDRFSGYGFIHHRSLNSRKAFVADMATVREFGERTHILEGDLCWDFSDGRELFYFRHPSFVVDTLSPVEVERSALGGDLLTLDDLEEVRGTSAFFVIELKVGRGDTRRALEVLVARLEADWSGRYWIDGFSLPMLEYIKSISPKTTVTLHTELVMNGRVVVGAPEWPPVRLRRLDRLPAIDGIAIRRRGSEAFMARACQHVHDAGKALVLSRLHTLREFECSKLWGAKAGYMHWPFGELVSFNDEIDARIATLPRT